MPSPMPLPDGFTEEGYRASLDDEIVALVSATYTLQDVLYTVADAVTVRIGV